MKITQLIQKLAAKQNKVIQQCRKKGLHRDLQTHIINNVQSQESEIQKDIKQQLYDELMKPQNLNKQWLNIKNKLFKWKLQKIEEEQKRLAAKLEELINNPTFDEYEEKNKLIALKRRIEQDYKLIN
ncbi:unnamed protein product [Paramecium sonneborni]|uniref:Uncharacterized protein n=1 Tax=Paramecium sonneborni TaxID=65129 RepID=A0A8S1RR58_9CILI|nr:unnamed protein product [Paramecium sonneborni]